MFSLAEYKRSIRPFYLEEPMDYCFFRPIAYIIVKLTWNLPLKPDHFSICSLIVSILSAYFLSTGTPNGFLLGGLGMLAFGVWDCCDGMLARLKNNGSKYGEFIDMFVDLISSAAAYIGLSIGLYNSTTLSLPPYLAIFSALCLLLHLSRYQHYKKQYLFYLKGDPEGRAQEVDKYKQEYENHSKGIFEKILLRMFLVYNRIQPKPRKDMETEKYLKYNKITLPLWGVISGASHLFVLFCTLVFQRIDLYFMYALIFGNIWFVIILSLQTQINRHISIKPLSSQNKRIKALGEK